MKTLKNSLMLLLAFGTIVGCQQLEEEKATGAIHQKGLEVDINANKFSGELPNSFVPLKNYASNSRVAGEGTSSLEESIDVVLRPGQTYSQTLKAKISGNPSKGDVMFILDLTGSMGGVLNTAKANSINIMNALRGLIPDTNFGAISHMDYPGFFSSCGYSATYGFFGDYPYRLDANITSNLSIVASGINGMVLGSGADGPENYTRPLWELSNDKSINWRSGSKKIAIFWLDNIPHDCNVYSLLGLSGSTGVDPGRDAIANTTDDLEFVKTLEEMKDNNITLITFFSGGTSSNAFKLWEKASELTGGNAFPFSSSNPDVADFIAEIIAGNLGKINSLSLATCDIAYSDWLSSTVPSAYSNIDLSDPFEGDFDVTINVPLGTLPGVYEFDLCLIGDGAEYAQTRVKVTVPEDSAYVGLDIHPGSCPNPLQTGRRGVTPVAVLGSEAFDVADVDISTIRLEGVRPNRSAFEDVSTPFPIAEGKFDLDPYCHTLGADGFVDLVLHFDTQAIVAAIGPKAIGELVVLKLKGKLKDGTDFEGEDIMIII
jgi:hypothetical protein